MTEPQLTGRTRLAPRRIRTSPFTKKLVLIHQSEVIREVDDSYAQWFSTRTITEWTDTLPEWLLVDD